MSRGQFHHGATVSGRRTMGRCSRQKPASENVVVIDVDNEGDNSPDSEVFVIDDVANEAGRVPTCSVKKGNSFCSNVINIDDDDDDDDVEEGGDMAGPSTTGGARTRAAAMAQCGFPRNRYGLDYVSDSCESDPAKGENSDGSGSLDCEILDDTSGAVRELWEKAASKRRMPQGLRGCKDSWTSVSTSSAESRTQPDENADNLFGAGCHVSESIWEYFRDVHKESTLNSSGGAKDGPSSFPSAQQNSKNNVCTGKETEDSNATSSLDPDMACHDETSHFRKDKMPEETPGVDRSPDLNASFAEASYFCQPTAQEDTDFQYKIPSPVVEENMACESSKPEGRTSFSSIPTPTMFPACLSAEWKVEGPPVSISTPEKMDEKIHEGITCEKDQWSQNAYNGIAEQNKETCFTPGSCSVSGQPTDEPPCNTRCGCLKQSEENCSQEQTKFCACNAATDKNASANVKSGNNPLSQKDLVDDHEKIGQSAIFQDAPGFQNDIIGEREKHKESFEYKRAVEEEWASRQRQLQIQAEEAQRLRRRRKAETLRLLDMERRQKQRLEEIRESQRKNEEDINLKEHLRVGVRKELENMERRYNDMASLLCGLGIPVAGGEVKAAYKQALLKFHPDRVSRSDIYLQVKAEETFKFISRLKEKLLPGRIRTRRL